MNIGDEHESLRIEKLERLADHLPGAGDLRVGVALSSEGFSGKYDQVWISRPDLDEFVAELKRMECERLGSARLFAMNEREFSAEFRAKDSLGHFEVEAQLSRQVSVNQNPSRVVTVFEVDPSALRSILREIREW